MTGGPNNWAAQVTYPPTQAPNTYVKYNYKDTVNVEWTSWAANSTETSMRIWWWSPALDSQDWQPLDLDTVPQNGTKSYKLDKVKSNGVGWYLGQWNLNFTREDQSPAKGLTLSQAFNCTFDDNKPATTWARGLAVPTSTTTAKASKTMKPNTTLGSVVTPTTTAASGSATNVLADATAAASSSSSASATAAPGDGLSGGAIAGAVVGVLAAIALIAVGGFLLWKRNRARKAAAAAAPAPPYNGYPPYPPTQNNVIPYAPTTQYAGYPASLNAPAAVYGAPGGDHKQPLPVTTPVGNEYYNKGHPAFQQMTQTQTYSELPGNHYAPGTFDNVSGNHVTRQELPG